MMSFLEAAGLFRDSWKLYKKYFGQDKDRGMWEKLIDEADGLYEKHGKQLFVKEMMVAVISEIERIDKGQ